MNKRCILVLLLISTFFAPAQDVRYYKLTRKVENGQSSTNVSGGQFITFFGGNMCYESNYHGLGVDHGTMKRNDSYSNSDYSVYQKETGSGCYWGRDASFKFNADKSVLNVVLENGDVWVYKQATAPKGQTTCSLVRSKTSMSSSSSSSSGGSSSYGGSSMNGGFTPGPSYPDPIYNNTSGQSSSSSNGSTTTKHQPKTAHTVYEDCPHCHGTGVCSSCNGKGWYDSPFTTGVIKCPNCYHQDGKCRFCGGDGKRPKTVWY